MRFNPSQIFPIFRIPIFNSLDESLPLPLSSRPSNLSFCDKFVPSRSSPIFLSEYESCLPPASCMFASVPGNKEVGRAYARKIFFISLSIAFWPLFGISGDGCRNLFSSVVGPTFPEAPEGDSRTRYASCCIDRLASLRPQLPPQLFAVPRTQCEPVIISAFEPGAGSSEWMSVSSLTLFFVVLSVLRRRWDIGDSAVVSTNRGEAARRRVDEVRTKLSNESMG
mmetsp:Transcript_14887/g.23669  ORF Transcript_14887/g.23669 Transcript_14887/m.23669 type:complete len:224 (-) Transcript_14887:581-1252(-)